jgi:hypothetical protein
MNPIRIAPLVFLCTLFSMTVFAAPLEWSIEDDDLKPVPVAVLAAVRSSALLPGNLKECQFVGKQIALDTKGSVVGMFLTTLPACWGAAVGPVVILLKEKDNYRVVLFDYGYSAKPSVGRAQISDIWIVGGTAGWSYEALWSYRERGYVKTKEIRREPDAVK